MREYQITVGMPTTVLLSDEDAERRGLIGQGHEAPADDAPAPVHKARTPRNKQA